MDKNYSSEKTHKGLSNDALDGIAAVLMIALAVSGVVYWLQSMPS